MFIKSHCFGVLNVLLNVSFQLLFSVATQFALPLDLLKELQNVRPDGVMPAQERH